MTDLDSVDLLTLQNTGLKHGLHTQINRYNYFSDTANKNRALHDTNEIQNQFCVLF